MAGSLWDNIHCGILGRDAVWEEFILITHEEALEAADKLAEYCTQHFKGNSRECITCQFSLEANTSRRCCLELYVGLWGEVMTESIKKMILKRNKELTK